MLRVVGAVVLVVLGGRALVAAWRGHRTGAVAAAPPEVREPRQGRHAWAAFGEGLLVQLANPKVAVFMVAFYPQFVPDDVPVLPWTALLAALQVGVETVLYLGLALGVGRASGWLRRPRVRVWLEGVSGTVLVGLGARVALTAR